MENPNQAKNSDKYIYAFFALILVAFITVLVVFVDKQSTRKVQLETLKLTLLSKDTLIKKQADSVKILHEKIDFLNNKLSECYETNRKLQISKRVQQDECEHDISEALINRSIDSNPNGDLLSRIGFAKTLQDAERLFLSSVSYSESTESNQRGDSSQEKKSDRFYKNKVP